MKYILVTTMLSLFFTGNVWANAVVRATFPPAESNNERLLASVMKGHLLVLSADNDVKTLRFLGEEYRRGNQIQGYDFVLPIGLRHKAETVTVADNLGREAFVQIIEPDWPEQRITLKDTTHVDISPENLARIGRETKDIKQSFTTRLPLHDGLKFAHPLSNGKPGGRFGARRIINDQPKKRHTGRDYSAPKGEKVYSSEAGEVVIAEEHFFAGNSVFIDHGDGWVSMYFHLDTIAVTKGQKVDKMAQIGTVGATGRATGPHLHYGFRFRNQIIDPDALLALSADAGKSD